MERLIERIRNGCVDRELPDILKGKYYQRKNKVKLIWREITLYIIGNDDDSSFEVLHCEENKDIIFIEKSDVEKCDITPIFDYLAERIVYRCSKPIPIPKS